MPSLAERPDLVGFFSYSRRDDEYSQGSLSDLRRKIYNELRMQLGVRLRLWQDTEAIPEGTEWEDEIQRAISESVFFIPIVSPNSVASTHCRTEFEAFLERELALERKNLVFPLLYVRVPALENEELWRQDRVLSIIGRRQYLDWDRLRFRSFTESETGETIRQFCRSIVESLREPWISPAERQAADEAQRIAEQARRDQEEERRRQVDAEARRQAEQQHQAAAEAQAKRVAEQARRDEEEKRRQQADAETRRQAEQQRRAAVEAEAQRVIEQARRDQERMKREQADYEAWQQAEQERRAAADRAEAPRVAGRERPRAETETDRPSPDAGQAFARAVIFIAAVLSLMAFFYLMS